MTYDTQKIQMGKTPVQIVELQLDRCTRSYGVAPCTAAIGVTGTRKCFNTFATCQDTANYATSTVKYRFSTVRVDGMQAAGESPIFPTLMAVDTAPTVLTPGKGLGIRSQVTVKICDHPWTDAFTDPYLASRPYNPDNRGTFWGRFISRNSYYQNRRLVVHTGFLDENGQYQAANFRTRGYIIRSISGPDASGTVTVTAGDVLNLADASKRKWPEGSTATLTSAIVSAATNIPITDPDGQVLAAVGGAGGPFVPTYLKIDNELMRANSIVTVSPLVLSVTRALMPAWYDFSQNIAVDHNANLAVQVCVLYDNALVTDIVYDLLANVCQIPTSYLPLASWNAEILNGFAYLRFSRLITEPVGVSDLLTQITRHNVMIWYDERTEEVRVRGLRFYAALSPNITDEQAIIADSVGVAEDMANLSTEQWFFYAKQWPLAQSDLIKSYRQIDIRADLDAESDAAYGVPYVVTFASEWLPPNGISTAVEINQTTLRQYAKARKVITWEMDPKNDDWWTGDVLGVSTRYVQDDTGAAASRNYLITQVEDVWSENGLRLKYTATEQFAFLRAGSITHPDGDGSEPPPGAPPDYSSAGDVDRAQWCYISANSAPFFPDASPAYQII